MTDSDDHLTQHRLTALHTNGTWDDVECLSNSLQRVRILIALTTTHADLRDLRDQLAIPRTTLQRNLTVLEHQGWIENTSSGYSTTGIGYLLAHEFVLLIERVEMLDTLAPFLNALDMPTAIDITQFEAPTVTVPDPAQPNAPMKRLLDAFDGADRVQGCLPVISWVLIDRSCQTADDVMSRHAYVISRAAITALRQQNAADREDTSGMNQPAHLDLYVYDDYLPYGLFLSKDWLALAAYNENGRIHALVESVDETTIEWGRRVYQHYRQQSKRLHETNI